MEKSDTSNERVVCVTGAGGYVASWLIKLLLSSNYTVHATLRNNPSDSKYEHLRKLEKAPEKLTLHKGDILDYDSIFVVIRGCVGVFHVASPVPYTPVVSNPEVELMEPAVKGTLNVLRACSEAQVHRVVFVSSLAAVFWNPNWPVGQVKDENCWSDKEYCKRINKWYGVSKTEAEMEGSEYARRNGLDMISVCPGLVLGPMLQSTVNASTSVLIKYLQEGYESIENKLHMIVDVRDLADALLMVYEKPGAEGRYICTSHDIRARELVENLRSIYPNYHYPKNVTEVANGNTIGPSSEKLQQLGWNFRPLRETLVDSVENYKLLELLN